MFNPSHMSLTTIYIYMTFIVFLNILIMLISKIRRGDRSLMQHLANYVALTNSNFHGSNFHAVAILLGRTSFPHLPWSPQRSLIAPSMAISHSDFL